MISNEALVSFKKIWKEKFHEDISEDFALERASKLIRMVEAVWKPMTKNELQLVEKRRKQINNN